MANTYILINSATVGSGGAANIEFTSIPSTYTDVLVKISGRMSTGDINTYVYFNSDTTSANYSYRNVYGFGSSTGSANSSSSAVGTYISNSGDTASVFASADIYIPNYLSSNAKSYSSDTVTENNGTGAYQVLLAGLWTGTSAISTIKLVPTSGNFVQFTTAYLYGISNS